MESVNTFQEWRSEEIAKILLLKSNLDLSINKYPTLLFDFFVYLKNQPKVKFAIEVKTKSRFKSKINQQIESLKVFRDSNAIDIPVLLFKIDEKNETGELDFLILPSFKQNRLLVKYVFEFEPLNAQTLIDKITTIINWYNRP